MTLADRSADRPQISYMRMQDRASWHDLMCERFSQTKFVPGPETDFRGELTYTTIGGSRMSRIHSSPGWFSRDSLAIRRDSFDGFLILMSLRGDLRITQSDKQVQAHHGEALIYRHGTPFELEFPEKYRAVSLWVSPEVMERHCPEISNQGPIAIRQDTTNGRLALAMVNELCISTISRKTMNPGQLVGATLDVVSTMMAASAERGQTTRNRWIMDRLQTFVCDNIENSELTLESLVEAAGTSARTLNRVFANLGTTPMRWLWEQRLQRAHDALARGRVRNVTEAAYSFGFKDGSHFSRAFSRRFGRTPISVLHRQ